MEGNFYGCKLENVPVLCHRFRFMQVSEECCSVLFKFYSLLTGYTVWIVSESNYRVGITTVLLEKRTKNTASEIVKYYTLNNSLPSKHSSKPMIN
jgi:hypothetical protein